MLTPVRNVTYTITLSGAFALASTDLFFAPRQSKCKKHVDKKGIQVGNFSLDFFSNILTDLKTYLIQIWAFYELLFPRYNKLDFPLEKLFPLEILPGVPIRNKIWKRCCTFLILNKYFVAELL